MVGVGRTVTRPHVVVAPDLGHTLLNVVDLTILGRGPLHQGIMTCTVTILQGVPLESSRHHTTGLQVDTTANLVACLLVAALIPIQVARDLELPRNDTSNLAAGLRIATLILIEPTRDLEASVNATPNLVVGLRIATLTLIKLSQSLEAAHGAAIVLQMSATTDLAGCLRIANATSVKDLIDLEAIHDAANAVNPLASANMNDGQSRLSADRKNGHSSTITWMTLKSRATNLYQCA